MKLFITAVIRVVTICCLLTPVPLFAAVNATDIMKAMDDVYRKGFTTAVVKIQLSTCKYVFKNGNMNCREKPRVTVLEAAEKKWGADMRDARSIALVLQPVADKGVGMLTYQYYQTGRENDVLLYLPALLKIRRVVSGSEGNEDGGSFFGTEFFVDDTQLKKIEQYTYKLIGEDVHDDRPVWIIESVPTPERAKKTAYGKSHIWVDKERKLILREDIFNPAGKLYRQRLNKDLAQVDNVWIARLQTMNNLATNRITALQYISITYNKDVLDELVTERSLTDFTFRERNLAILRAYYK